MSKEHELPSDSDDEDDEDYIPEGAEAVSEVDSDGEAESALEDEENDENRADSNGGRGSSKGKGGRRKKGEKRRRRVKTEEKATVVAGEEEAEDSKTEKPAPSEEEEKKRADSLWADFMKDTGTISKPKPQKQSNGNLSSSPLVRPKIEEKVKITKIFEFAGEEVKVEKEVPADSAEARLSLSSVEKSPKEATSATSATAAEPARGPSSRGRGAKRAGGLGGISSVLGQLGKKAKISTLEKSKLDWDSFKREENIDEEINTHNRGKDGYLERQDFLQRADLRQFELEKQMRVSRRSTR